VRHFGFLDDAAQAALFDRPPADFAASSPPDVLAVALGATLYMPGTRPALARDVEVRGAAGVMSVVVCLEDSVADEDLPAAERNVVEQLQQLASRTTVEDAPLVFVRVRQAEQVLDLVERMGDAARRLTGFVLPKFDADNGPGYLAALAAAESLAGTRLLAMPVLESAPVMHRETRLDALLGISALLQEHRDRVLAVRLGAADLSGLYALRRTRDVNVYDVAVVRDVISDVVNVLGRADGTGFAIAGPVWEHFAAPERLFRPQLRATPFADDATGRRVRERLITADHDELLREVVLDQANGLVGKTVIHPSHVGPVHALMVVSHEEHDDACAIVASPGGGASSSSYRNKMNEARPHQAWAQRVLRRSELYGVAREGHGVVDVLTVVAEHFAAAPARA
jgi:citrate lyase beta subunit